MIGISVNNGGYTIYADPVSIQQHGDMARMNSLSDFHLPQKSTSGKAYLSSLAKYEYDCKKELARLLASSLFSGNMQKGEMVMSKSEPESSKSLTPLSAEEALWKYACHK